tara:strand:+ start:606 stop:989 length:384 start_codon:yes stop_codon:yes gene_type:complete
MSTLQVGTIKSASSAAPVFQNSSGTEKGQIIKAWCRWRTSGGAAIEDSFNVSSVSDNGTGFSFVNFTNSFSNANYAVVCTGQEDSGGGGRIANPKNPETSRCQIEFRNTSNSARNAIDLHAIFIGDN